jgi:hypothetical protein
MKYLGLAGIFFATLVFGVVNTTSVEATPRYCPNAGYCPPGTCMNFQPGVRGEYACNVANCSAANCRRYRLPAPRGPIIDGSSR